MGCTPCLPVPAFNKFTEKMDAINSLELSEIQPVNLSSFSPSEFENHHWPVQPGNYRVYESKAPIALAFLGDRKDFDSFGSLEGLAICGSITTENLGVEHVVKNIIANPFIRHLVLFGKDVSGHLPGNALLKLSENGVEKARILGARGGRPILKNLLTHEVEHFKKQVTIHNLMDQKDETLLEKQMMMLKISKSVPFKTGLLVDLIAATEARAATKFRLDPEGYFVIMVRKGRKNPLYVEHYTNDGRLTNIVKGKDAATVCSTLLRMNLVSQMDHAAYLGRELAKAESSLLNDKIFVQDRAQGDLNVNEEVL